ncbi:hypothetical protein ACVIKP_006933 [Rhizobium leguminosarum]|jgi:hypothetical protein|uniref:Uncharacterized protein n=1 Tax=Rhizobium laguerreae TaxID=1076926 RepID=A0AAX2QE61_9HYPH|nr:hypothetical protein EV131_11387 [Rhizobium laguerreae]
MVNFDERSKDPYWRSVRPATAFGPEQSLQELTRLRWDGKATVRLCEFKA